MSEKKDLWVPVALAAAGLGLLAWNLAAGNALLGVLAAALGLLAAGACLPLRLKRGQNAMVTFGIGAALLLATAVPGVATTPWRLLPWVVLSLAFLVPLRRAAPAVRIGLLAGAAALGVAALLALGSVLPKTATWLLLSGALHLALQSWHTRPLRVPEAPAGPRICVFGGTFDPFHRAHRALCESALKASERLLVVVAANPPHKEGEAPRTPFHHRVAMTRLGVEGLGRTEVLELEGKRQGPSYTVDTLDALRRTHPPEARFRLLIGADMYQTFPTWHEWEGILERATLLVAARPGWDLEPPPEFEGRNVPVEVLEAPAIDVASTRLREDLAAGREVGDRVSPAVRAYIREHGLYRDGA